MILIILCAAKAMLFVDLYIEQHRSSNIGVCSIYRTPRAFSSLGAEIFDEVFYSEYAPTRGIRIGRAEAYLAMPRHTIDW